MKGIDERQKKGSVPRQSLATSRQSVTSGVECGNDAREMAESKVAC